MLNWINHMPVHLVWWEGQTAQLSAPNKSHKLCQLHILQSSSTQTLPQEAGWACQRSSVDWMEIGVAQDLTPGSRCLETWLACQHWAEATWTPWTPAWWGCQVRGRDMA